MSNVPSLFLQTLLVGAGAETVLVACALFVPVLCDSKFFGKIVVVVCFSAAMLFATFASVIPYPGQTPFAVAAYVSFSVACMMLARVVWWISR